MAGKKLVKKILYCLLDGYGDLPLKALGGMTPLEYAETPFFDFLASHGGFGLMAPAGLGKSVPLTDASAMLFSSLGYDVRGFAHGRGMLEAVGAGLKIKDGDFAARCNFATVDSRGVLKDLRAGRIQDTRALEKSINAMPFEVSFLFKSTTNYRGLLVFKAGRGRRYSADVTPMDPHEVGKKILESRGRTREASETARLLNAFVKKTRALLAGHPLNKARRKRGLPQANCLLPRGFGTRVPKLEPFKKRFGLKAVALNGMEVNKGVCALLGMRNVFVKEDLRDSLKELELKRKPLKRALGSFDFAFVHFKGPDKAGHDGDVWRKTAEIEMVDSFLARLDQEIGLRDRVVVLASDHCTPCGLGGHSTHDIPALVFDGKKRKPAKFSEKACRRQGWRKIASFKLMKKAVAAAKRRG